VGRNDPFGYGQAQSGSFLFCGVKGFENVFDFFVGDSGAGIDDI
jgi:hypothetical protein